MPFFEEVADEFSQLLLKYYQAYPSQQKKRNTGEENVIQFLAIYKGPASPKNYQ